MVQDMAITSCTLTCHQVAVAATPHDAGTQQAAIQTPVLVLTWQLGIPAGDVMPTLTAAQPLPASGPTDAPAAPPAPSVGTAAPPMVVDPTAIVWAPDTSWRTKKPGRPFQTAHLPSEVFDRVWSLLRHLAPALAAEVRSALAEPERTSRRAAGQAATARKPPARQASGRSPRSGRERESAAGTDWVGQPGGAQPS
jgi:hypothetical protein